MEEGRVVQVVTSFVAGASFVAWSVASIGGVRSPWVLGGVGMVGRRRLVVDLVEAYSW